MKIQTIAGTLIIVVIITVTGCGDSGKPIGMSIATHYVKGPGISAKAVCVSTRTLVKTIKNNAIQAYKEVGGRRALASSAREMATLLHNSAGEIRTLEHGLPDRGDASIIRRMRTKSSELGEFAHELMIGNEHQVSTANYVVFLSLTVNPLNDC